MLESEEHGQETVFDRYKSVNFNSLSRDFQIHIRALALWVMEKGGLPFARSRTFHGVDVGGWLYERCLCPHAMSEVERTVLRCVPGVLINSAYAPVSRHDFMLEPSRVQLWRRLRAWAKYGVVAEDKDEPYGVENTHMFNDDTQATDTPHRRRIPVTATPEASRQALGISHNNSKKTNTRGRDKSVAPVFRDED